VHDADPQAGTVEMLFEVRGPGTAALAATLPGDVLDVVGPLGGGCFPVSGDDRPSGATAGRTPPEPRSLTAILVGGGVGLAPLLLLARVLGTARARVRVLAGVASRADLVLVEPFYALPGLSGLVVATEERTAGAEPGLVADLLARELSELPGLRGVDPGPVVVYACGPRPMLREVSRLARGAGVEAWVSVEERMACGVGACRGCAVRTTGRPPYRLVCRDGPVFAAGEIDWGGAEP